jgi:hypothetical protein
LLFIFLKGMILAHRFSLTSEPDKFTPLIPAAEMSRNCASPQCLLQFPGFALAGFFEIRYLPA